MIEIRVSDLRTIGPNDASGWVEYRFKVKLPDGWRVADVTLYSDGEVGIAAAPVECDGDG